MVTGKLPPVKLHPGRLPPPATRPWVRVRAWARVRVGGNLLGGNLPGGNFPSTGKNIHALHHYQINFYHIIKLFINFGS